MSNVKMIGASDKMTPEQALKYVLQEGDLEDVLIVGYDKDGELVIRSSAMTREQALFMSVKAQEHAMGWK